MCRSGVSSSTSLIRRMLAIDMEIITTTMDSIICYIPLKDVQPLSFGVVRLPEDHNPILKYFLTLLENSMNQGNDEAP